jgi:hypothetical protein
MKHQRYSVAIQAVTILVEIVVATITAVKASGRAINSAINK